MPSRMLIANDRDLLSLGRGALDKICYVTLLFKARKSEGGMDV